MTCEEIKEFVKSEFGIEDLEKNTRQSDYIKARFAFCYLCYKYSTELLTYRKVGEYIKRDHATVMYNLKEFPYIIESDKQFKEWFMGVEDKLRQQLPLKDLTSVKKLDGKDVLYLKREVKRLQKRLQEELN